MESLIYLGQNEEDKHNNQEAIVVDNDLKELMNVCILLTFNQKINLLHLLSHLHDICMTCLLRKTKKLQSEYTHYEFRAKNLQLVAKIFVCS